MKKNHLMAITGIAAGIILSVLFFVGRSSESTSISKQELIFPRPPFSHYITGVGIVEASSENIHVGTTINRVIKKVLVQVGHKVKKGTPLVQLQDDDLISDLVIKQTDYEIAIAKLQRLLAMPRTEDLVSAESALKIATLEQAQARQQYEAIQGLDSRALSSEEMNRRRYNFEEAEAKVVEAKTKLEKIREGTWKPDLEIAKLEAQQAKAGLAKIQTEIERTLIRSPIDGTVLQIKVHEGEAVPMDTSRNPLMIVGNTEEKYLDVSINQFNASYFRPQASAIAYLQGDPRRQFPLEFVRLEPFLVSKQNLTNNIMEKVDTRVLQVTYRFKENPAHLFVGQQMDVFIKTNASQEYLER